MPNHLYSFLCTSIIVDKITNLASYIGVISDGAIDVLPKEMPAVWLASCWMCTEHPMGKFTVRVTLKAPSGKTKPIKDIDVADSDKENNNIRRHMVNLHISKFTVEEEGLHYFEVKCKKKGGKTWKKHNDIPLFIQLQKQCT